MTGDSVKISGSLYNTTCKMAVDRHHQGKRCAFAQCPSFGHFLFSTRCFPRHCRWWSGRKSQEVLWIFRIFPNKRNGHETYSFYRGYSKIILGSSWWQGLLLANCFTPFGTENRFNYFSFSPRGYPENRENKRFQANGNPSVCLYHISGVRWFAFYQLIEK